MNKSDKQILLEKKLVDLFEANKGIAFANDTATVTAERSKAIEHFKSAGFPMVTEELWRGTDLSKVLSEDYHQFLKPQDKDVDLNKIFVCDVHNFDTDILSLFNGWVVNGSEKVKTLPNGVIMGSLSEAMKQYPDIFEKYYNKSERIETQSFNSLNTAMAQDGAFIFVPDGVQVDKTIQMISIVNHDKNLLVQNRNMVILGKNSSLTMVQCDDSTNNLPSFNNSVTEVFVDENSQFEHYKLQNLNNSSTLINSTFFSIGAHSTISSTAISLNGGLIRNNVYAALNGSGGHADVCGVYLMDKKQHVDNYVFIDHKVPDCTSNELFKGILDEEAKGVFNGHILVRRDAQRTNAFQNNKNILLTDTATIDTKPFLEIYADDVKCSHGATVGQLDTEAMFYLRSRGISEDNARMLLMYAFAAEVISKISIEALRTRIDDMVKKRLRGELSICETCVLHCGSPENEIHFDIDMSKI
jgi:Fe-S cluster assembly protein SufD